MKYFVFYVLMYISSSYAQVLQEKECSPVDIRDTNPKISKSPSLRQHFTSPRDQGQIGWCYGFSASDLLSAHLGADVSSFHVSALYNRSARKNPLRWLLQEAISAVRNADPENKLKHVYDGGFTKVALEEAMKNAYVCSEKDLPFDPDKTLQLIGELEKIRSQRRKNFVMMSNHL